MNNSDRRYQELSVNPVISDLSCIHEGSLGVMCDMLRVIDDWMLLALSIHLLYAIRRL
jgi:hypothetical protein